jgi:hypothetical protein
MDTPDAGPVSNGGPEHNSSYRGEDTYRVEISPDHVSLQVAGGAIVLAFDAANAAQFGLEMAQAAQRAIELKAAAAST